MDWILSVTTVLVNSGLGWFKGVWWMWAIHAANAAVWILYAIWIEQYGLIAMSLFTIVIDIATGFKAWRRR